MNHISHACERSQERTLMETPESPAADADTRALITWLMQVQYHGGMASPESRGTLLALAHALPSNADTRDPDLASVVAAIQSFANTAICDPYLSDKAGNAIDSLTAKLPLPVRVVSPSKKAAPAASRLSRNLSVSKCINFDKVE